MTPGKELARAAFPMLFGRVLPSLRSPVQQTLGLLIIGLHRSEISGVCACGFARIVRFRISRLRRASRYPSQEMQWLGWWPRFTSHSRPTVHQLLTAKFGSAVAKRPRLSLSKVVGFMCAGRHAERCHLAPAATCTILFLHCMPRAIE